jgi:hypothetical protein
MAKRGRKPKDQFSELSGEEKDAIASMTDEEIKERIAKITMDQAALEDAKKNDGDLKECQERLKVARAPYKEAATRFKQLIAYKRATLDARGKESGTSPIEPKETH